MNRRLTLLLWQFAFCAIVRAATGDSWELKHTFTNRGYGPLVFNGTQFECFQGLASVAISTNLTDWAETETTVDTSLYDEVDSNLWYVFISLADVTALPSGQYLAVLAREMVPKMGNVFFNSVHSMLSTDGIHWDSPALVHWLEGYTDGHITSARTAQANDLLLAVVETLPMEISLPVCSTAFLLAYSAASNTWTRTFRTGILPRTQLLFSDGARFYFSYGKDFDPWEEGPAMQTVMTSRDGSTWDQIGSEFIPIADSHAGQIVGPGRTYTPGRLWETTTNTALTLLRYNGNRIVGFEPNALVVSDDYGRTWQRTELGACYAVFIIEARDSYVALVQTPGESTGPPYYEPTCDSSIYTIPSQPLRTPVTAIAPLGLTQQVLRLETETNAVYQIECVSDLRSGEWLSYGLPVAGDGALAEIHVDTPQVTQIFFRARALNTP